MYSLFIYIYIHCKRYLSKYIYLGQITIFHLHPNFPETAPDSPRSLPKRIPEFWGPRSISVGFPPLPRHRNLESRAPFTMQPFLRRWRENPKRIKFCKSARNFWGLDPWKLTWQYKTHHLKMYFLFNMGIFHCHVSFLGVRFFSKNHSEPKKNVVIFLCFTKTQISKLAGMPTALKQRSQKKGDLLGEFAVRNDTCFSHIFHPPWQQNATATKMQNLMTFPWYWF